MTTFAALFRSTRQTFTVHSLCASATALQDSNWLLLDAFAAPLQIPVITGDNLQVSDGGVLYKPTEAGQTASSVSSETPSNFC